MTTTRASIALLAGVFLAFLSGCWGGHHGADLADIYGRAAREHPLTQNPVIVIPGILGTQLVDGDSGRDVWGAFSGDYANPHRAEDARLIGMPMRRGAPLSELRDRVQAAGALETLKVGLFGLPIELEAYMGILGALGAGGFRDQQLAQAGAIDYGTDHFTCFQFDYDWRRDNVENVKLLHEFILSRKEFVEQKLRARGVEKTNVKFDLVAHSMGGLIARYYLRHGTRDLDEIGSPATPTWEGTRLVDRAVLVATPSAGSVYSVRQLVDGIDFSVVTPDYSAALLGTMPAIYQLLPRSRHRVVEVDGKPVADIYDPAGWERRGWGLADPDQSAVLEILLPEEKDPDARRQIALDHQRKCLERARRLAEVLDTPARLPSGLELYLVLGDAISTPSVLSWDTKSRRLSVKERSPGDGTVTRASALLDERIGAEWRARLVTPIDWTQVTFLFDDHLGLTRSPVFIDNLLYLLLERPLVP